MLINFCITLQGPPPNFAYALQKGSGSKYEVVQPQRSNGNDLHFDALIEIKGSRQTNEFPDFKGPFVQGPVAGRFIYIDIGSYAGGFGSSWSGRLKIPLSGITWDVVENALSQPQCVLKTTVPGTGKNGLPNCATVKPFNGWAL